LFSVSSGARTSVGTIRLHKGAVLTGRITDRRGRPVVGAVVGTGMRPGERDSWLPYAGADWRTLRYAAATDAQGRYRIQRIEPLRQAVVVFAVGQPYAWQCSGEATDPPKPPTHESEEPDFGGDGPIVVGGLPDGKVTVAAGSFFGAPSWFDGASSLATATPAAVSPNRSARISIRAP
jgi:hypothetical protein